MGMEMGTGLEKEKGKGSWTGKRKVIVMFE